MTANWKAETDKWTIPINLRFAKLSSFGPLAASYVFGGGVYAAHSKSRSHLEAARRDPNASIG